MHVTVTDGCISCGLCADEFPELFHLNDEGVAEAVPSTVASDQEEAARQKNGAGAIFVRSDLTKTIKSYNIKTERRKTC